MSMFDIKALEQYKQIFGYEKMLVLFEEFKETAEKALKKAEKSSNIEELRLVYHSLRSSSLVFGMKAFSGACEKIEEKIIEGTSATSLEKEIKKAKMLYKQGISEAYTHLRQG